MSVERIEEEMREALAGRSAVFTMGRVAPGPDDDETRRDDALPVSLGHAGEERRARYRTGRRLAREALRTLGATDLVVGRDRHGCPEWPMGFVGSISHSDPLSAALVACRGAISSVGIDLERVGRFGAELWPSVLTPAEMRFLLDIEERGARARAATVLFSAKEAVQKARYSETGAWSEHARIVVELDVRERRFRVGGGRGETGRFVVEGAWVFCAFFRWGQRAA